MIQRRDAEIARRVHKRKVSDIRGKDCKSLVSNRLAQVEDMGKIIRKYRGGEAIKRNKEIVREN